jgi:hypothetical protein
MLTNKMFLQQLGQDYICKIFRWVWRECRQMV